ncbi:AAA family ATPase [Helicobacter suis]|uniref:AAA family ATPase n=1 Tax=Helicobacter suis TaxID=104628 RepID=UPI001F088421|nr:AAA family ATPase [Helicobacter suis]
MAKTLTSEKQNQKIAFVIDWSNYLFGPANALTAQERRLLQTIGTSLRDAQKARSQHLLVFIVPTQNVLPPSLYLNNAAIAQVPVPYPSAKEREEVILANKTVFKVQQDLEPNSADLVEFGVQSDGLSLKDIQNLAYLSSQQKDILSVRALISLYKFGKKDSPWEKLDHKRLQEVKTTLQKRLKGQDHAIDAVEKILKRAYTGLSGLQHSSKAKSPKGVLFLVGPTGVGKTELARSLAEFLFGEEEACIRFDMSEFNHEHADQRLLGAPPGYVGFEEGGQLTNAVQKKPFCLLLFDEIEKAHPRILDKFLQILEDGRLTDGKGQTVQFVDTFIVFTSNIGAAEIAAKMDMDINSDMNRNIQEEFRRMVQKHFVEVLKRPELLGRIGEANIIPFNFIQDTSIIKDIIRIKLNPLIEYLKEKWGIKEFKFIDQDKALDTLCGFVNIRHGGRGVLNILTKHLMDPLAEFLFIHATDKKALMGRVIQVVQAGKAFDFDLL